MYIKASCKFEMLILRCDDARMYLTSSMPINDLLCLGLTPVYDIKKVVFFRPELN